MFLILIFARFNCLLKILPTGTIDHTGNWAHLISFRFRRASSGASDHPRLRPTSRGCFVNLKQPVGSSTRCTLGSFLVYRRFPKPAISSQKNLVTLASSKVVTFQLIRLPLPVQVSSRSLLIDGLFAPAFWQTHRPFL